MHTSKQDLPSASLSRAEHLFVEMIRQVQEERTGDVGFFHAWTGDKKLGLSVSAFGGGNVHGGVVGKQVTQVDLGLDKQGRDWLIRRGWTLPEEEGVDVSVPSRNWDGVTARADRRHIAQEMLSVLTDIYSVSKEQKVWFELQRDGTAAPASSESQS